MPRAGWRKGASKDRHTIETNIELKKKERKKTKQTVAEEVKKERKPKRERIKRKTEKLNFSWGFSFLFF